MSAVEEALREPAGRGSARLSAARLPRWWPLAALTLLAAALRLATLDLQSFWYDEAFTPVHVLHGSLWATLRAVTHTENSPPLWYVLEWADARILGTGEVALRLPSALAGIAAVPVAWRIGLELAGRRAAILAAALMAVGPLFVWYSQEARAYSLFVLAAALAMLCFVRAQREPTPRRMAAFALSGSLALLTHYFAVFLLIGMVAWLLARARTRRAALPAIGVLVLVGCALVPLIAAQGGRSTQWIGRWPLSERLAAIVQYYLTGTSGAPLGHGIELLIALPLLAGVGLGLWRLSDPARPAGSSAGGVRDGSRLSHARELDGAKLALALAGCGVLIPLVLVAFGADYLAPRNLIGAMVALSALIAVLLAAAAGARAGVALAVTFTLALLAISLDVDLSPRLQRGNWRALAHALGAAPRDRAISTVELGAAPLEYYIAGLRNLPRGRSVMVSEIDETGYAPLRRSAGRSPAPGFRLIGRRNLDGLLVYRFVSPIPRLVSEETLRRHVITLAHPEVLVPSYLAIRPTAAGGPSARAQMPSRQEKI
ncbi:MAG: mannosyltransferase [Solirubrobacteraceae bacterium]|jgi:4-amino-4-deoxy-L-arabinose transferase-like glycosyltransferase|nr:mannosyltransferase [Solirubrobacteraceae bacterium]